MDVTPTDKMYRAMCKLTDALCGDEPSILDHGRAADAIRMKRTMTMDVLHKLVALSMREGVNRAVKEAQQRMSAPDPKAVDERNAVAQARDDAHAGTEIIGIAGARGGR